MGENFRKRFKSSSKFAKNSSIFENLIPIEKKIKNSQMYAEISLSSKLKRLAVPIKELGNDEMKEKHNLPPIKSSSILKSRNSIDPSKTRRNLNESMTPKYSTIRKDYSSHSPINIRLKIKLNKDLRKIDCSQTGVFYSFKKKN